MPVTIKSVKSSKELKEFILFANRMYKGNPYYVPCMPSDDYNTFDKEKNGAFDFSEAELFLAYKDGKTVGRVAAIVNHMLTRTTRSGMIDVLRSDYLMLARAKGVSEKMVVRKHALKNALIPIITVSGIQFSAMMGGAVTTEAVFSFPGIGTLLVGAIKSKDTVCVTGCLILTSLLVSVILLLVDILYAYVDPRIKAQYSK